MNVPISNQKEKIMKGLKTTTSKLIALGLLIAVVAIWSASRTRAFTLLERPVASFGAAGLTFGQTFRFNGANIFADGTSNTILKVFSLQCNGLIIQVAEHTFTLGPGQCETFDFDPAQSQISLFDQTGRAELVGVLLVTGGNGPADTFTSEVFDNITGKTNFLLPAVQVAHPGNN